MRPVRKGGISTNVAVVAIVVLVIIAASGWGIYAASPITKTVTNTQAVSTVTQTVTGSASGGQTQTVTQTASGTASATTFFAPTSSNQKFTITTFDHITAFAPFNYVQYTGLATKYIPDANFTPFANAGQIPEAMASGQVQMALLDPAAVIPAIAKGAPLRIVADVGSWGGEWGVVVAANSSYTTLQSLHGGVFEATSAATVNAYLIEYILAQQLGWQLNKDYTIAGVGSTAAEWAALAKGAVSSYPTAITAAYPYLASGQFKSVYNFTVPYPAYSLFATTSFIQQHPDAVRAAVYAFLQADYLWNTNQTAAVNFLEKNYNLDPNGALYQYQNLQFATDGYISLSGLQNAVNLLLSGGAITQNVSASSLVSTDFAPVTS